MSFAVKVAGIQKVYYAERDPIFALKDVSFEVDRGEFLSIMGPSGCGKSTLLHIIGAMDRPTAGQAWIKDIPLHSLSEEELTNVRRSQVGFVFQFFYLLPTLTIEENISLPLLLSKGKQADPGRVLSLLDIVGLTERRRAKPNQLSGGEMQRAALARAIVNTPPIVLADEPTGNLDSENGEVILKLLQQLSAEGTTVIMATHSDGANAHASRCLQLKDGSVVRS